MEKFLLKYFTLIRVIIAIAIGIVISVFLIFLISREPGFSLRSFLLGPLLTRSRFAHVFETASPIIFCGLAIAVAFQAKQFNIGAEGSLYIGAAVATAFAVSTNMPAFIHIPLVLLVGGLTGAAWSFIPGILKAKWKASELVSSLMLNYVAYFQCPETAWLPRFIPDTRIHYGIILALVAAVLVYYFLYHTTTGYEIRSTGFNDRFARYGGINVFKVIILCQVILGFLAAVGGTTEIMGIHRRFVWQDSPGYGWSGIIVAIIGRNHPLLIIPASFFLSYMQVGGRVLNLMSDVPAEMITVIQSIIILLITAEAFLSQWKYRITLRQAEKGDAV